MATIAAPLPATTPVAREATQHPLLSLISRRLIYGLVTLFVVSIIIFWATEVLPGNAAYAVLGHSATPARLHALEVQMGLEQGDLLPVLVLGLRVAHGQARHLARERRLGLGHRRATPRRLGGARGDRGCHRDRPRGRARRVRRLAQGQAVRPRLLRLRPRRHLPARVRRGDHPHHPVRHRRVPPPAGGLAAPARHVRLEPAAQAARPAGGHARARDRPLPVPDDAGRHDRGPRVRLRRDGAAEGPLADGGSSWCTPCRTPSLPRSR